MNYFYKITNKINGHYYFGVHKTDNLEDGYMGSGKRLRYDIKKYGRENFEKEILEFFDTYKEALDFENEIVTEDLVLDENCYNLKKGGTGGFVSIIFSRKGGISAGNIHKEKLRDPEIMKKYQKIGSQTLIRLRKEGKIPLNTDWTGKRHNEKTKSIIGNKNSKHQKGIGNSQYGTCWITNEKESKKILKEEIIPDGWRLGRIMHP